MDNLQTISSDLVQSINEKEKKKPIPYDTYAKVIRIDGGTAWVHIPGGVDETPVAMTVNANVGDSVLVRVSGGNAWIVGNSSAPPTDDTKAVEAKGVADVAQVKAASAQETAETAEEIAKDASRAVKSTSQYFWHNSQDSGAGEGAGAHITEVPQEDFIADPANGGGNLLAQSGGIAIRDGVADLATFGANGEAFWNEGGGKMFQVGRKKDLNFRITESCLYDGSSPFSFKWHWKSTASVSTPSYTYRFYKANGTEVSIASIESSGAVSADGAVVTFSETVCSEMTAKEVNTIKWSYIAGYDLPYFSLGIRDDMDLARPSYIPIGTFSVVFGTYNKAEGDCSYAGGQGTLSAGDCSHAEGTATIAQQDNSFAIGDHTHANDNAQFVTGRYNEVDTNCAFIVGNGDQFGNSNAFTVDWGGEVFAAGGIRVNGHTSEIGHKTTRQIGTYSLASGKSFVTVPESALSRITLSKGTWIIHAHAAFESNNTGRRTMMIYSVTSSEGLTRSYVNQPATIGAATNMNTMAIVSLEESNTFTLQLAQNSGSAKSVNLILEAVRIA